jgi:hypothetical protein
VGSLGRRIQQLEDLYAMSGSTKEEQARRAEQRAALLEDLQRAKERAALEALETGDSRRLAALKDLERHMLEGMEWRREDGF